MCRAPSWGACGSAAGALQNLSREIASRQAIRELGAVPALARLLSCPDAQVCCWQQPAARSDVQKTQITVTGAGVHDINARQARADLQQSLVCIHKHLEVAAGRTRAASYARPSTS